MLWWSLKSSKITSMMHTYYYQSPSILEAVILPLGDVYSNLTVLLANQDILFPLVLYALCLPE